VKKVGFRRQRHAPLWFPERNGSEWTRDTWSQSLQEAIKGLAHLPLTSVAPVGLLRIEALNSDPVPVNVPAVQVSARPLVGVAL